MKLKKWVRVVLLIISIGAFIIMASDCDDTLLFITSHLIACSIFALCTTLLIKYSGIKGV